MPSLACWEMGWVTRENLFKNYHHPEGERELEIMAAGLSKMMGYPQQQQEAALEWVKGVNFSGNRF